MIQELVAQRFASRELGRFGISLIMLVAMLWGLPGLLVAGRPRGVGEVHEGQSANKRPFTVADSIGMTHMLDPLENSNGRERAKFSPSGDKFFILTEKGNLETNHREYSLLVFESNNLQKAPQIVASFASASNRDAITNPRWVDDGHIAFIGEKPGETPQVHSVDLRNLKLRRLTSDPNGVLAFDMTRDAKRLAYYAIPTVDRPDIKQKEEHGFAVGQESLGDLMTGDWKRPSEYYQMYLLDTSNGRVQAVRAGRFSYPPPRLHISISPDGRYAITEQPAFFVPEQWVLYENQYLSLLARDHHGVQPALRDLWISQAMLVDMNTGEIKPLIDAPTSFVPSVFWSGDSHSVVVANTFLPLKSAKDNELEKRKSFPALVEVQVPSLSLQQISEIPKDTFWEIQPGDNPEAFLVQAYEDELQDNEDLPKEFPTVEFRKHGTEWSHTNYEAKGGDLRSAIKTMAGLNSRPKLVKVDPVSHKEVVLLDPNPRFDGLSFGHVDVIHWVGKRSEPLAGGLVYPTNYQAGTRYPLVIQTHGFSPDAFLTDGPFTAVMAAQELANKGTVVLQLGESPLYDRAETTSDFGPVQLSQIESAVDQLDNMGLIDRNRVGLVGFSITGFMVRYALMNSKYRFAAATVAEGNDFGYWQYVVEGNKLSWQSQTEVPYGGPPWNGNWGPWLKGASSFNYGKIHTPLRIESDSNPGEVLFEWENFVALKRLGRPVELIYQTDGYHPVVKPWQRMTSQQGNVDWLVFWLKGEEDPDPAKAEQYERWHELRKLHEADLKTQGAAGQSSSSAISSH